jgi:hypothetical protein
MNRAILESPLDANMKLGTVIGKRRHPKRATADLRRHQRKCRICRHEDRESIEFDFLVWKKAQSIVDEYGLGHRCLLYRHAHATGLLESRKENFRSALDTIIEQVESAPITGATIIRAMRAYSCLRDDGSWVDLPKRAVVKRASKSPSPTEVLIETPGLENAPSS